MRRLAILLLFCLIGIGFTALRAQSARLEYRVVGGDAFRTAADFEKELNALAREGWELVSVVPLTFNNAGVTGAPNQNRILTTTQAVFKRPAK